MKQDGVLSVENIDFQFPLIYKQLINVFGRLNKKSGPNDFVDAVIEVKEIIKHGMNMNVVLVFDTIGAGSYVMIPSLTSSHALYSDGTYALDNVDGLTIIRKAKDAVKGTVDSKRCKLGGVFSSVPINVHMPKSDILDSFLSPEELAAVFCHEVGHGFSYFEYLSRTATTNQILAGMSKALDGSGTAADREVVLTAVAKSVGLSTVDIPSLSKTEDRRVLNAVVITAVNREYAKETGYDIYDRTSSEQLADQFATRLGAGKALVTGLDKMYRKYGNISYRSTPSYLFVEAVKVALLVTAPVLIVAGGPAFGAAPAYLGFIAFLMIISDSSEFGAAGRYDMPGDRFKRVRAEFVERLKNRALSPIESKGVQEDIQAIDSVIDVVNDRRQFFGVMQDILTSTRRFSRDMKLLQQSLERLASNDLFLSAAKLQTASQA